MSKIAIYPGTFDPITNGHIDILVKASLLFDQVILAVANKTGKNTLFSIDKRLELCKSATADLKGVKIEKYDGLTIDFANKMNASTIIRGLRNFTDFQYELQMAMINKKINLNIETLFLIPEEKNLFISSTMIKQIAESGGDVKNFVPECVERVLSSLS